MKKYILTILILLFVGTSQAGDFGTDPNCPSIVYKSPPVAESGGANVTHTVTINDDGDFVLSDQAYDDSLYSMSWNHWSWNGTIWTSEDSRGNNYYATAEPEQGFDVEIVADPTIPPPDCDPCGDIKYIKQEECGGIEHWDAETFNDVTCESECVCEGDGVTFAQIKRFCESDKNSSFVHDPVSCTGECAGDCSYEYKSKERECGLQGIAWWNDNNCTGECNDNCTDEYNILEADCGIAGIKESEYDYENCTGECREDCTSEYSALEIECGLLGIATFDDDKCEGTCKNCNYEREKCGKSCSGFISNFTCEDNILPNGNYYSIDLGECECVPASERFLGVALVTGYGGADVTDNAGAFGGIVEENADGSMTETLDNGGKITYNNSNGGDRPNGSITYITPSADYQEHYTDADGNEIVLAYDAETDEATETISSLTGDGITHSTTTITENYSESTDVGEVTNNTSVSGTGLPDETETEEESDEYDPEGDPEDLSRVNYAVLQTAVSQFGTKQPFSSVGDLQNIMTRFDVSPVTPSWDMQIIPAKWGGVPFTVELSAFDGVAAMVRYLFALGLWALMIWQVIKMWTR